MILWIIACIACFVLGDLKGQGKLNWVRGAAGKAAGVVVGRKPVAAPAAAPKVFVEADENPPEVSPTPPKNPIKPLKVAGDALRFLWHWRHFIVAGLIALLVWGFAARVVSFVSCPFGPGILWCADSDRIDANADTEALEHEADMGREAVDLSERTHNNIDHAERAAARGQQDIEDAIANLPPDVSEADFLDLDARYRDAYLGVYSLRPNDTDPGAGRTEPVRRSRADAA